MAALCFPLLLPSLLLLPVASSSAITAAPEYRPALLRRQSSGGSGPEETSCGPWLNLENSCAAANPSFTLLTAFASQAPCLCYSSSTWAPDFYDSALATCLAYLSTASPAYYTSSIDGPNLPRTPCLDVASVVGPGASASASGVTSSAATQSGELNYQACLSWQAISSSCDSQTPGFASLPVSAQDNCLCYTSGTYAPSVFDDYWQSCLTYFSTASPIFYSMSLGGDAGEKSPCALYQPTATPTGSSSAAQTPTNATSGSMASSGAGVTTSGPASTSIALTTTAATTTSAHGSGAVVNSGGVSMIGALLMGMLGMVLVL